MSKLITSSEQLKDFLANLVKNSVDLAKTEVDRINEASRYSFLREQEEEEEEAEEEEEIVSPAEAEVEEEAEEEVEEEPEEEAEEVDVEVEDDVEDEKDPMQRRPASERAPKRPEKGSEVTLTNILYDINQIRSGRSLRDPDVRGNLEDYFNRLTSAQRIALSEFLQGLTDVIVKGVPGDDAEDPSEEVKMSETEPEAETEEVEAEAEVEEKVVGEKPAEDLTPPIQVRR